MSEWRITSERIKEIRTRLKSEDEPDVCWWVDVVEGLCDEIEKLQEELKFTRQSFYASVHGEWPKEDK
jgi:hypothetical protein